MPSSQATRTRNGWYETREKSSRHPSWTELDTRHGKHGKSIYDSTIRTRTQTRTQNGRYVDTGKKSRRPSWTELHACHGKQGKSTDDSTIHTRTSTCTQNGLYGDTGKKFPTPVVDGAARVPWKTWQKHRRFHDPYMDQYTYPERAVWGHGK